MTIARPWAYASALGAFAFGLSVLAGCAPRRPTQPPPRASADALAVLAPVLSNRVTQAAMNLVERRYAGITVIRARELEDGLAFCLRTGRVLLIPSVEFFPLDMWPFIERYLASGGRALFIGRAPFGARVERTPDGAGYRTQVQARKALLDDARAIDGFSDVQIWRHRTADGRLGGGVRVARSRDLPWPGVEVEADDYSRGDTIRLDAVPPSVRSSGANTLALYARGDRNTTALVVECIGEDGSVWTHVLPVSEAWAPATIHESMFVNRSGGPGAGLRLSTLHSISIGLSDEQAPQSPGKHVYGVSDVRVARDPRPLAQVRDWPDAFLMSPPERTYASEAGRVLVGESEHPVNMGWAFFDSPYPRGRGWAGSTPPLFRWIPVAQIEGRDSFKQAWPASLCVGASDNRPFRWGWIGLDVGGRAAEAVGLLIDECVSRLHPGRFLLRAGADRLVYGPGGEIRVTGEWIGADERMPRARIMIELLDEEDDRALRRVISSACDPLVPVELSLGRVPFRLDGPEDHRLRISLLPATTQQPVFDRIEQPIKFLPPLPIPNPFEQVTVTGAGFREGRQSLFLLGLEYAPLGAYVPSGADRSASWLDRARFDGQLVGRDLDRLQSFGVNAVAVRYRDPDEASALRFFLEEAKSRQMYALIQLEGLDPLAPDLDKAARLIQAADLSRQPRAFAFAFPWSPWLGPYGERIRLDPAWREWIVEQYGRIEHAEEVIGRPLWRTPEGLLTGPPDEEIARDGDHRIAIAVYRRFVDDLISRETGRVRRFLRSMDCRQLLCAPRGWGDTWADEADSLFPIGLQSGVAHLDFVCPIAGDGMLLPEGSGDLLFLTAYARGVGGGKPVVWMGYGANVSRLPRPADLQNQGRIFKDMFTLVRESLCAGAFGSLYPGGWRADERADRGVVHPDGAPRPAANAHREFSNRMRGWRERPAPWAGREVNAAIDARGVSALRRAWGPRYGAEADQGVFHELRPSGFGKPSTDLPALTLGSLPFRAPAPLEYLNAEWDGDAGSPDAPLAVGARQPFRANLINTGPATWAASQEGRARTVWVRASSTAGHIDWIPLPETPFTKTVTVSWTPRFPGLWTLRPWLMDVGGFGQSLAVRAMPPEQETVPRARTGP